MPLSPSKQEQELISKLWSFRLDPEAFVQFSFPWGQPNTPLATYQGPRTWQRDELQAITAHNRSNLARVAAGLTPEVYFSATCSGRGIGKSALTSWLAYHGLSCLPGSTVIVTANTEPQLKSRTWAELGKWHTLALNSHWFDRTALSLRPAAWYETLVKTQLAIDTGYYYAQAQLWNEECPDAFAGVHNPHGVLLIFDEASGIVRPIWDVSAGFFTDVSLYRYWWAFSNGRQNTGEFFECFHKNRDRWRHRNIDSRTVEGVDTAYLQSIVDRHGEDHDVSMVEVKGGFPAQGANQFISRALIEGAQAREAPDDPHAPLILGVDVARFGDDSSVLRWRQGRNARVVPPVKCKGLDNMALAHLVAHWIDKTNPDAVCIDAGNGTGVIDRLREMRYKVHEIHFGSKANGREWFDKRSEMYALARDWLAGGSIDGDRDLADDLAGPGYEIRPNDKIKLESKEKMKSRGLASPDNADALVLTFAVNVARRDFRASRHGQDSCASRAKNVDFDVFA